MKEKHGLLQCCEEKGLHCCTECKGIQASGLGYMYNNSKIQHYSTYRDKKGETDRVIIQLLDTYHLSAMIKILYMLLCATRGGASVGGFRSPSLSCGGGRGGGCVGASGRVWPCCSSFSLGLAPGPQATEGAFHSSPFNAACVYYIDQLALMGA